MGATAIRLRSWRLPIRVGERRVFNTGVPMGAPIFVLTSVGAVVLLQSKSDL